MNIPEPKKTGVFKTKYMINFDGRYLLFRAEMGGKMGRRATGVLHLAGLPVLYSLVGCV